MSVVEKLKAVLPATDTADTTQYRCQDCGNRFRSSDPPEEAKCMRCISTDVEQA